MQHVLPVVCQSLCAGHLYLGALPAHCCAARQTRPATDHLPRPGFCGTKSKLPPYCQQTLHCAHCEVNIDDCSGNPCLNNGKCTDGINEYSCQCVAGYFGRNCETNCPSDDDTRYRIIMNKRLFFEKTPMKIDAAKQNCKNKFQGRVIF